MQNPSRRDLTVLALLLGIFALSALPACQTGNRFGPKPSMQTSFVPLSTMQKAYDKGNYTRAYQLAANAGDQPRHRHQFRAAYIAGMSALRINKPGPAEHYLRVAFRGTEDSALRGQAGINLGMLFYHQQRYRSSSNTLLNAAKDLRSKTDRANAYYYAAVSEQKLGRMPSARPHFILARGLSSDASRKDEINQRLNHTGYTIRMGAFDSPDKARKAADDLVNRTDTKFSTKVIPAPRTRGKAFVRLGEFTSYQSANAQRERLGLNNAIIVPLK